MSALDPYLGAIKAAALLAIALGLVWLGWHFGAQGVQAKWDAETTARANAEKTAVLDRVAQNKETFIQQERTNDAITKAHNDELNQVRAAIANASRLRPGTALCGGFAAAAEVKSAGSSNAADPASGVVSESVQRSIDALTMQVEEALATGRACQKFVVDNGMGG